MNRISKLAKIGQNVKIGKNNIIGDYTVIADNVVIGNNNQIYPFNKIYPNVIIGNNNIFLENNIIGEHAIEFNNNSPSMDKFTNKIYNGVVIGNNNFLNTENIVYSGTKYNKTIIGNNNKFGYKNHIGHDVIIRDYVHLYTSTILGGYSILLSYSGMGLNSIMHQKKVLGSYAFTGALTASTKHIFPFLITVENKYTRVNNKRAPEIVQKYEKPLFELMELTQKSIPDNLDDKIKEFPEEISNHLIEYYQNIISFSQK